MYAYTQQHFFKVGNILYLAVKLLKWSICILLVRLKRMSNCDYKNIFIELFSWGRKRKKDIVIANRVFLDIKTRPKRIQINKFILYVGLFHLVCVQIHLKTVKLLLLHWFVHDYCDFLPHPPTHDAPTRRITLPWACIKQTRGLLWLATAGCSSRFSPLRLAETGNSSLLRIVADVQSDSDICSEPRGEQR